MQSSPARPGTVGSAAACDPPRQGSHALLERPGADAALEVVATQSPGNPASGPREPARNGEISYDNALAQSVNALYKAELIRHRQSWRTVADVELATAAWVDWWNQRRLHGACGDIPPAEFEAAFARREEMTSAA